MTEVGRSEARRILLVKKSPCAYHLQKTKQTHENQREKSNDISTQIEEEGWLYNTTTILL